MKKIGFLNLTLLLFVAMISFSSCKKDKENTPEPTPIEPTDLDPSIKDAVPEAIREEIFEKIDVYQGDNPPCVTGGYLCSPNSLVYFSVNPTQEPQIYSDLYFYFQHNQTTNTLQYYSRQLDPSTGKDVDQSLSGFTIHGDSSTFTYSYIAEGYPDGLYAKQSTIYSGEKTPEGIKNYQKAVILIESSGNPKLYPNNTYRIFKDLDGLAENDDWFDSKGNDFKPSKPTDEELFGLFRIKK